MRECDSEYLSRSAEAVAETRALGVMMCKKWCVAFTLILFHVSRLNSKLTWVTALVKVLLRMVE